MLPRLIANLALFLASLANVPAVVAKNKISDLPQIERNVTQHLPARLRSTLEKLASTEGPNMFEAWVRDARLTWQLNIRSIARLTMQHQQVTRNQALYKDEADATLREVGASAPLFINF